MHEDGIITHNEQISGTPRHESGFRGYVRLSVARGKDKPSYWPAVHNRYVRSPLFKTKAEAESWVAQSHKRGRKWEPQASQ